MKYLSPLFCGILCVGIFHSLTECLAFYPTTVQPNNGRLMISCQRPFLSHTCQQQSNTALNAVDTKATLTEETMWQVRIQLKNISTKQGKVVSPTFLFQWKFLEDINYEPPQGTLEVVMSNNNDKKEEGESKEKSFALEKGRWTLSEDPNDRKDSLWIWGLFKEPLYPFLLLTLETPSLPYSESDDDDDFIPPLKLYSQITHRRDPERGAILPPTPTAMTVREMETVDADVLGVAKVDIYEEKSIGQITIVPKQ